MQNSSSYEPMYLLYQSCTSHVIASSCTRKYILKKIIAWWVLLGLIRFLFQYFQISLHFKLMYWLYNHAHVYIVQLRIYYALSCTGRIYLCNTYSGFIKIKFWIHQYHDHIFPSRIHGDMNILPLFIFKKIGKIFIPPSVVLGFPWNRYR